MVKPGGTGRPRFAISARFAPLPPSRFRICALPSALPSPKPKTHFPFSCADLVCCLKVTLRAGLRDVAGRRAALVGRERRAIVLLAMMSPGRAVGLGGQSTADGWHATLVWHELTTRR